MSFHPNMDYGRGHHKSARAVPEEGPAFVYTAENRATLEAGMDVRGILGMDSDIRNGFDGIKVTYDIDADATKDEIAAVVAQSQKRSAVYDIITNPTNVTVQLR